MKNYLKPKTKSRTKEQFSPIGQIAETSTRYPDISGIFLIFFKAKASILSEKLSDYGITRPRGTWRDTGHTRLFWYWAVFGCSRCIRDWTALFVPFFGLFQTICQTNFCIVCTVLELHFLSKSQKALGGFQIIFQTIFASLIPDLTLCFHPSAGGLKREKNRKMNGTTSY